MFAKEVMTIAPTGTLVSWHLTTELQWVSPMLEQSHCVGPFQYQDIDRTKPEMAPRGSGFFPPSLSTVHHLLILSQPPLPSAAVHFASAVLVSSLIVGSLQVLQAHGPRTGSAAEPPYGS